MISSGIMDAEEFEEIISKDNFTIIDFSATWCGPCRMMAPIVEDVSAKRKEDFFYQIDVDSSEDLAAKFNITVVPTFVVVKSGKEIARTSGYMEIEDFEAFLDDAKNKANA